MWGKMIVRAEDEEGGGRGSAQRVWVGAAPKEKEKKNECADGKGRTKRLKVWKREPDDGTINVDTNGEWMRVKIEII